MKARLEQIAVRVDRLAADAKLSNAIYIGATLDRVAFDIRQCAKSLSVQAAQDGTVYVQAKQLNTLEKT